MLKDFIQVSGEDLVVNNAKVVLRGLGVGSWMNIEHFMLGLPGTELLIKEAFREVFGSERSEEFFDSFLSCFLTEEDFGYLSGLGVNALRLPVNYHYFIDDQNPDVFLTKGFKYLDSVLELCKKYRIYAIIDLHAVPGGQNPDWHSGNNTGIPQFWHFRCFRDQITRLWGFIAGHYRDNPWVGGYDLLNEPFMIPDRSLLNSFYEDTVSEIRKIDRNHVVFLEGDRFAMDFSMLEKSGDPQTAYEFHYYPTVWNPDALSESMPSAERTRIFTESFNEMLEIRERFRRPLWCGELGCTIAGGDPGFIFGLDYEMLTLCEKNGVSWTLWSYKDSQCMGLAYPEDLTPWVAFTNKIRAKWSLPSEMETANSALDKLGGMYFEEIGPDLKYRLQFRLRTLFHTLYVEQILKPELKKLRYDELRKLPESFLFGNCGTWKAMEEMLKRLTSGSR